MRFITDSACLVSAFDKPACEHPDRIAVSAHNGALTYRQLDERSSAVGAGLIQSGVKPGAVVALLTDRSTELAVGILGILKAGAAYLPLDPTHPSEWTAALVGLAQCSTVVTTAQLLSDSATRADTSALRTILIDEQTVPADSLPGRTRCSLAYVLPTSGSTGRPKGVQIEDRNVLALVEALRATVLEPLNGPLRIALVAPHIFDASVQQIFSALLLGHTLAIVPEQARADGGLLRKFWADECIAVSDGTPAHLRIVAHAPSAPRVRLRQLLIGGDVLSTEVIRRFLDECDTETCIVNMYGVAECCVDSLVEVVDRNENHDSVPIGKALPGTTVELLDDRGDPVPDGEMGELYISGAGVGRGYLARPELTAERFHVNPSELDQRRYRTGDMARRLPDGRLVFVGRSDRQFKLRGHRIEPGEVESTLRGYVDESASDAEACQTCLLTSSYPKVTVTDGLCSVCARFAEYRDAIMSYFSDTKTLLSTIQEHSTRERSGYDVMLLFSGGKDSTYALYRLLDLGLRVLAFTFDNGYIAAAAFENIRRITSRANVDLEVGSVPTMNAVFAESLRNDSTVCSGCFRGLTSMSTQLAAAHGIGIVVTGLSRGQIFDTKLRRLVESGITDPEEIDRLLMVHRKVYNARQDRTAELLALPLADEQLDNILFLDYFRYDNTTTSRVKKFLANRDKLWAAPTDTGLCSTNCRINEVGIYVHSVERGYHNYASPLSWDCRLGVLSREQGLRELVAVNPRSNVTSTLRNLGYTPRRPDSPISDVLVTLRQPGDGEPYICAHYASSWEIPETSLRDYLKDHLPPYMVPARFVRLDALPVTQTGKFDLVALPEPGEYAAAPAGAEPQSDIEIRLAEIWREVLDRDLIGRDDDFFSFGGDSLTATIVAGLVSSEFNVVVSVVELFTFPTIAHSARLIDQRGVGTGDYPTSSLTPSIPEPVLLAGTNADQLETFLLPDVWGGVKVYQDLATLLPGRVWGLSGPATTNTVGKLGVDTICNTYAERLGNAQADDSYHLGGWSFGGILAHGVAHELHRRGGWIERLVVVDTVRSDQQYWNEQLDECQTVLRKPLSLSNVPTELRRVLSPDMLADASSLRTYAMALMPVLEALADYRPPTFQGNLIYVRASDSDLDDRDTAWWRARSGAFEEVVLPGSHLSILSSPLVTRLAACFVNDRVVRSQTS